VSRRTLLLIVAAAALLAAALIAASLLGRGDDGDDNAAATTAATATTGTSTTPTTLPEIDTSSLAAIEGVPQNGLVLGRSDAPALIVEYADLQCPFCAQFAEQTVPELVDRWVRPGKARIEFRGLAGLGPDSEKALRFVLAAAERGKGWSAVKLLYANQGEENAGWVTDELLRAIAAELGLDPDAMVSAAASTRYDAAIEQMLQQAQRDGVDATPFFLVGGSTGTTVPVAKGAVKADAFDQALAIASGS
jgi:protein-disulfide isomerase